MKFSILVNKWANFYFFVQNLSEWHFSNHKDYNALWRKELEQFSVEEEKKLEEFKIIRQKYRSSRSGFEKAFFLSDSPLQDLATELSEADFIAVEKTFNLFKNKFEKLYKKDLPHLMAWKDNLSSKINDADSVKSITDILNVLFNVSVNNNSVSIYLLFSSNNHAGGGANIDDQSVILKVSRYPLGAINIAMGIVWHEVIHLLFQNHYFFPLLLEYLSNDSEMVNFVNEVTTALIFPKGVLGLKLLNNELAHNICPGLSPVQTAELINLMKEYIEKRKMLDRVYIEQASRILKIKKAHS